MCDSTALVFMLLIVFQLKHFLADYIWQGRYMLGKFKAGWDFLPHLLAHVSVHGLLSFMICYSMNLPIQQAALLAVVDMTIHFFMDRIKAGPKYLGRYKPVYGILSSFSGVQLRSNKYFWWSLGFDQSIHHLTHYFIIWQIVASA